MGDNGAVPYPRKLLGEGEDIVLDFHPHWIYLMRPIGWTVLWCLVLGAGLFLLRNQEGMRWKMLLLLAVVIAWVFTGGAGFIRWRTTEYVLTTDRLITREGIIAKAGLEIPLENINDIAFNQSIFERMVGSGDLRVESAGELGQNRFHDIPKPHLVQNEIYTQIEQNRARIMRGQSFAAPPAASAQGSVPRQIEELARLRDQGLLSAAEFEAKKAELLKRM